MPRFLSTRGKSLLAIGICGRCSRKFPLVDLEPDRNSPGLLVCREDNDEFDPYRLPARQTEDISLPFARPDRPLNVPATVEEFNALATEDLLAGLETENDQGFKVQE